MAGPRGRRTALSGGSANLCSKPVERRTTTSRTASSGTGVRRRGR
ncbi:hypothetical protein KCH_44210 [Kitasatospora cheerisanensis KCTC 2395]|uniref:Uncharacterized protein n=1 Tax=Kitasatospora cheerisanensis KCTC 2395 TaxID=1348663 RepID=A0A066YRD0_9ACTN|nr:hypothetical protein KCH_44210 [Kitasatospora cheerisanensis KCTC 2395]